MSGRDGDSVKMPCPTCSGPVRETVGMVCQTCGADYGPAAPAAAANLRAEITEALSYHFTDRDELSGCAMRCGYDGDDRAEHLATALLALPALQRLVTEAAEAARLRETVARVEELLNGALMIPQAQVRRALDGEGTDG